MDSNNITDSPRVLLIPKEKDSLTDALILPSEAGQQNHISSFPNFSVAGLRGPFTTADGLPLPVDPVRVIMSPSIPVHSRVSDHHITLHPPDSVVTAGKILPTSPSQIHIERSSGEKFDVRILVETAALLIASLPIFFAPYMLNLRGFYCECPAFTPLKPLLCTCQSPDLAYPYRESSVQPWVLYLLCLLIPFVMVVIGEYCRYFVSRTGDSDTEVQYRVHKKAPAIPPMGVSFSRVVLLFIFGLLITKSLTDMLKYAMGALRPHFLEVCQPDYGRIYKDGGCGRYVADPHCRAAVDADPVSVWKYQEARLGFISEHASIAFYSMIFVAFYAESRFRWIRLRFGTAVLQFGSITLAALFSASRVTDNMHHWPAVLLGGLLGSAVSYMTVMIIGNFFNDRYFVHRKLANILQKIDWDSDGAGGVMSHVFSNRRKQKDSRKKSANRPTV